MKNDKKNTTDKKQSEQFPGYPVYPDTEDITRNGKRVSMDDEGNVQVEESLKKLNDDLEENLIVGKSELTKDDLLALGPIDQSLDEGDDELLRARNSKVDFSGKDLDVPGSELDDESESIGSEDEENNSYSIGGDNHDNLEERQD
ncbi:MAG TPA: hypothetical protein VIT44_19435 [Cyclobacteriaceae bacterium]